MDPSGSSDTAARPRLVFVASDAIQARLFGDLALRLHRRGVDCRFVVHGDAASASLQPEWGERAVCWWEAGKANQHVRPAIRPWLADARPGDAADDSALSFAEAGDVGRIDAWRFGWTDSQRERIAGEAAAFWSRIDLAGATLIVWNGGDGWFVEAAVERARRIRRPVIFVERGPLRRCPRTLTLDRDGTFPGIGNIPAGRLGTPLWPLEQQRLAAMRERFCAGTRPYAHPRPYILFPLQPNDDPRLFRAKSIFVDQREAVAAVVAAMPAQVDLFVQAADTVERPIVDTRSEETTTVFDERAETQLAALRPHDRWLDATDDTLAMIAGAAAVVTINSPAGVEALMWDRPLVVLGEAGYSHRGITFDLDDRAALPRLLHAVRSGIRPAAATSRQDRFLYQLLRHDCVEVNDATRPDMLDAASLDRLADAMLAELGVTGPTADWSAVTRARAALEQTLRDGLAEALEGLPKQRCLAIVAEPLAGVFAQFFAEHQIVGPADADDLPSAVLSDATCLVFLPDASPGRLDRVMDRLRCRGAAEVIDLAERLSRCAGPVLRRETEEMAADSCVVPRLQGAESSNGSPVVAGAMPRCWIRSLSRAIAALAPERIVEFGCRDGQVLEALRHQCPEAELIGIEFDEALIEAAARRIGMDGRVQLVPADAATGLPLAPGQVDTLVTCGAIDRLAESERAEVLAELRRLAVGVAIHLEHDGLGAAEAASATRKASAQLALHEAYWDAVGPVQLGVQPLEDAGGSPHRAAVGPGTPQIAVYQFTEPLLTVLTLHSVGNPPPGGETGPAAKLFLPTGRFASILGDMLSRGWRFITLSEAFDRMEGGLPLPRQTAVLTFDDGYRGVFSEAFPILAAFGLRAAVFPVVSAINGRFDGYARGENVPMLPCLTAAQLRELHAAGWDIGSHTLSHPCFAHLSPRHVHTELCESRDLLSDLIGGAVRFFAFPHGQTTDAFREQHVELVRAAGYSLALTGRAGFVGRAERSIAWPRIGVGRECSPATLRQRLMSVHRHTAGWLTPKPSTELDAAARVRQIVRRCLDGGWTRVALYGADAETRRLLSSTRPGMLQVTQLVDDAAEDETGDTLPVRRWRDLDRLDVQAVLVPAGASAEQVEARVASRPGLTVLRMGS